MSSLTDLVASQDNLVAEAAEALPHSFAHCTYPLGSLRQAVYLCLTCALPRGICSACSIACHTDHEQLELFPKRDFRCDCPTRALSHTCTLHTAPEGEEPNAYNAYGQNFRGLFCRCGRTYDVATERETMIQCLACEDWFHESCLNLRSRPSSRAPSPGPSPAEEEDADDAASDTSSSGLPPPLIRAADYDAFVCGSCVARIPTLKRYAGTPGVMSVVRDDPAGAWRVVGGLPDGEEEDADVGDAPEVPIAPLATIAATTNSNPKRPRSHSPPPDQHPDSNKRPRVSPAPTPVASSSNSSKPPQCIAPPPHPLLSSILALAATGDTSRGAGDVFLTDGWRARWCLCSSCRPSLSTRTYLLEEEETYEPPADADAGVGLEELGMRALLRMPRERAMESLRAFNGLRDELVQYLRPFAQEGREVGEADVWAFFEARREARR